jgi:AraC family transcriptional regulator of adaptative response/methylated-DNA-[protein]-cysteine methyltransferase
MRPTNTDSERDPRWQQVLGKDRSADGSFFYSVETTGVFCKPSCGARLPKPSNVRFHRSAADAVRAGFRACKRCKPDAPSQDAAKVAEVCRLIDGSERARSSTELARTVGLRPAQLSRMFKAETGVTPKQYAAAKQARAVRTTLSRGAAVSDAIYEAGFNSTGRFYERADSMLGMKPSEFRSGGERVEIRFAVGECALGGILVASTGRGVCAILMGDDPDALVKDLQDRFPRATLVGADREYERVVAAVVGLVESPELGLALPLDVRGTAFQQRVWDALRKIPAGKTTSYAELAARIGAPKAVRAVAGACAANPIAVAIPCHRVVRTDGGLSGYRWGIERKRKLLAREKR